LYAFQSDKLPIRSHNGFKVTDKGFKKYCKIYPEDRKITYLSAIKLPFMFLENSFIRFWNWASFQK